MTRRLAPAAMPDWPRLLRPELAAAYTGRSVSQFLKEVDAGKWPKPYEVTGGITTFDRAKIDQAISGIVDLSEEPEEEIQWRPRKSRSKSRTE